VTIPAYYAYRLIDALTKILPARDTLEEPEPFFGTDFTKPRGVNVTYPNDDTQQEVRLTVMIAAAIIVVHIFFFF
jgi:hypothetical protein